MKQGTAGLALVLALTWCGIATAQQDVEASAKAQFDAGVELYKQGKLEQASVAFARAYELRPSYKILYLVGKCENDLGHFAASLDAFTRYLAEGADEIDKSRQEEVRKEITRLNALVGTVAVETDAIGATVFVDGHRSGDTPLEGPLFVDLGEHEIVLKRGGDELHREVVKVAGGQQVTVTIKGASVAAPAIGEEKSADVVEPKREPKQEPKPKRVWTWVALGAGAAAGIAGGVIGGISMKDKSDFLDRCGDDSCGPVAADERDRIKRLSLTADILYGVAGALAITAVILFFVEPDDEDEETVAVLPSAGRGSAGLSVTGRF